MQWNLKLTKILLVTIILVFMATTVKAEVDIKAESAILIEAKSGDIIHELNVDKKWYPASMTKLMTLAVVLDLLEKGQVDLNERVVTSENAASYGGAQLYLEPGEEFTLDDMLKAIIIGSANDASVAVAEHIAGSEQAFAELMNEKAKEIGALNTHFVNSHGLHDENHYTTAKDMALIGQYSLRFPKTLEYTSMQHCEFRKEPATERYSLNKLLWWYPGTDGFKTGTTSAAKRNFVGTVERDGLRLISVVMGVDEPNGHFRETMKLFNHGFANYIFKQFVANIAKAVGGCYLPKMQISVWDLLPACSIFARILGSLILLRIRAILAIIVSTKPSLEPRITLSKSGSSGWRAGYCLLSKIMILSAPSTTIAIAPDKIA
jgi:D-alanyl-D-alanine carboxypeptidase (penicillin-binding protein 5/6)